MPGENCSIYGCGTCRNQKVHSLFKIPTAKDEYTAKWRSDMLSIITKDRVLDTKFKNQISANKVFICEKHFEESQLYICKLSHK